MTPGWVAMIWGRLRKYLRELRVFFRVLTEFSFSGVLRILRCWVLSPSLLLSVVAGCTAF